MKRACDARDERGVILIVVALCVTTMMLLGTFVVDMGGFWLGRAQAQNAADAGALAGAVALELDNATDFTTSGAAYESARTTASHPVNKIFGGTHGVEVDVDPATMGSWTPPAPPTCLANQGCVQVSIYQDGTHSSATLPTLFARILGINSQGVRATATAQVLSANSSNCLRPWFFPDKYTDANGNGLLDAGEYTAPGYNVTSDLGTSVTFHQSDFPSAYGQLDVGAGAADIGLAIKACAPGLTFTIGETLPTKPGGSIGPEREGVDSLLQWDPDSGGVHWDPVSKQVVGGCAPSCTCPGYVCPYYGHLSPRIVQAVVCDPYETYCSASETGSGTITVTNILSFFITGYDEVAGPLGLTLDIHAVLIGSAGTFNAIGGPAPAGASFLKTVQLVR